MTYGFLLALAMSAGVVLGGTRKHRDRIFRWALFLTAAVAIYAVLTEV